MPTYSFLDTSTNERFDSFMKISEREDYLKSNPHIQPLATAAAIVGGVSITDKTPNGFKEVLSKISEAHPSSSVAKKHGKKTIKQIKTEQIVKKHLG
jgi:hypothetical protein